MFIVYKTTNLINEKFYIGVHKIGLINDNYLGSGKALKQAIKKYGKLNFKRDTLFVFNEPEEAYQKEKELVNKEIIKSKLCYNCRIGGRGLRQPLLGNFRNDEWKKKISEALKGKKLGNLNSSRLPGVGKKISDSKKGVPNFKLRGRQGIGSIPIMTPVGKFNSKLEASKYYNVNGSTIDTWIKKQKFGFYVL